MNTPLNRTGILFVIFALIAGVATSFAADVSAPFKEAEKLYAARAEKPDNAVKTIRILEKIENESDESLVNYKIFLLESQAYFWLGFHADNKAQKKEFHKAGMDKAEAAKAIDDKYAEAHYAYSCNLGRWALANGIFESLFSKGELIESLEAAIDRETLDGDSGETVDGYGPYRVLGRLYLKLPGLAGGSFKLSKEYLQRAHEKAGDFAINTVYYAATLMQGDPKDREQAKKDKAEGKRILEELFRREPKFFHELRRPESLEAVEDGHKLYESDGSYDVQ